MTTLTQDEMDRQAFDNWWRTSKYMQVVISSEAQQQAALDGWQAALKHQREASAKELAECQAREAKLREILAESQEREIRLINKAVEEALKQAGDIIHELAIFYYESERAEVGNKLSQARNDVLVLIPKPEKG